MAIKIGFINFTGFDSPLPTEYAAYEKLERRLEPYGHVKSLFESHRLIPPLRTEPPALFRTPDARIYKLAAELAPWMDEYHHRALDLARIRERVKYIERYRFNADIADFKHYRHIDLLHSWIVELLFERVYRRAGRMHQLAEKAAKHEWLDTQRFIDDHREQRIIDAKNFPELHRKEMAHPYRFDIKEPNEKKVLQKSEEHILGERRIAAQAKTHMLQLRQLMHELLFDDIRQHLAQQFVDKRGHANDQARSHLRNVLQAFDKAWTHAWDSSDTFKKLMRKAICDQAELYPKLFRKSLVAPFELEIREPNDKSFLERIQEHIQAERQHLNLVRLEEEACRQLTKNHKLDITAYRLLAADRLNEKIGTREWEQGILTHRKEQRDQESRDHVVDAVRVESQGYQLLAGRMVPQPKFAIDTVFPSSVPLSLGIHGDPSAPEHVAPAPLLLPPPEQRDLWNKVRATQVEEQRLVLNDNDDAWQKKTQGIRQNLAAIEYGEQQTKELMRPDLAPRSTDSPPRVDATDRVEPSAPVKRNEPKKGVG